jgi:mono/diheme cytochrome c family protein
MMFERLRAARLCAQSLCALICAAALLAATAAAQGRDSTTAAPVVGAYTGAQAERGKARFITSCGNCHGVDLKGAADRGPALAGDPFMKAWQSRNADNLFAKIKSDMPRNQPGSLKDDVYLDIVAFILQANAFPEGPKELSAAVLDGVPIASNDPNAKSDPKKIVPNFAMVAVVGCLTRGPNNTWMLTSTSEPVLSKDQPSTTPELKDAALQPLGSDSFQLVSIVPFKPDDNTGHKMAAKGLLYRAPNENRLDVTSLQMVTSSCAN